MLKKIVQNNKESNVTLFYYINNKLKIEKQATKLTKIKLSTCIIFFFIRFSLILSRDGNVCFTKSSFIYKYVTFKNIIWRYHFRYFKNKYVWLYFNILKNIFKI